MRPNASRWTDHETGVMRMETVVEHTVPSVLEGVRVFSTPVRNVPLQEAMLAHADEVRTFAVAKRRDEHLTGRWLLQAVLEAHTSVDSNLLMVVRDEHRAPRLAYIHGVWVRTPLPSISICHSNGRAFVAMGPPGWGLGLDAEPEDRTLASNAFDLMASGEELSELRSRPEAAMRSWVGKEAVQKAMGLGMHLNPRHVRLPIGMSSEKISIEHSKIQLEIWSEGGFLMALAARSEGTVHETPEDRLLAATKSAMDADPTWGVGCNTTRNSV